MYMPPRTPVLVGTGSQCAGLRAVLTGKLERLGEASQDLSEREKQGELEEKEASKGLYPRG